MSQQAAGEVSNIYNVRTPGQGASTRFKIGVLAGSAAVALFGEFTQRPLLCVIYYIYNIYIYVLILKCELVISVDFGLNLVWIRVFI